MKKDPRVYLAQILERIDRIREYTTDGKGPDGRYAPIGAEVCKNDFNGEGKSVCLATG